MNDEMITVIIKAVIAVVSVLITSVVIPYIKGKIGENKYNEIKYYVEYAVRCAEQLYTPEQWKEKKEYVKAYIVRKASEFGLNMTEEDLDILIEGVVNEVKHNKEQ